MVNYSNKDLLDKLYKDAIEKAQKHRLIVFKEVLKTAYIDYLVNTRKYKEIYNLNRS